MARKMMTYIYIEANQVELAGHLWLRLQALGEEHTVCFSPTFVQHDYEVAGMDQNQSDCLSISFRHLIRIFRSIQRCNLLVFVQSNKTPRHFRDRLIQFAIKCNISVIYASGRNADKITTFKALPADSQQAKLVSGKNIMKHITDFIHEEEDKMVNTPKKSQSKIALDARRRSRLFGMILSQYIEDCFYVNRTELAHKLFLDSEALEDMLEGNYPIDILDVHFFNDLERILNVDTCLLMSLTKPIENTVQIPGVWLKALKQIQNDNI